MYTCITSTMQLSKNYARYQLRRSIPRQDLAGIVLAIDYNKMQYRVFFTRRFYRLMLLGLIVVLLVSIGGSFAASLLAAQSREPVAPQVASYRMDVRLDPTNKTVSGTERISYTNPSQDNLRDLWLHLYLKAFSSLDTLWMRESGGQHRGFSLEQNSLGDITVSSLTLADGTDLLSTATFTDTLLHLMLPVPLAPGQTVELDVAWTSKLPRAFARTGYGGRDNTFFMVGQWYPKMAVYNQGQWDTEPWHANSEFFHDFGSYDVSIAVPQAYVVAATGVPTGEADASDGYTMRRFTATNVTDFAFAASPDFRIRRANAGNVETVLYYLPEHEGAVAEYIETAVGALQAFSEWYGPYPHARLSVVDVPDDVSGAGGMEYPTLVTGGTLGLPLVSGAVALVTSHEIGHQWWPMQTATHEGREPWLDEGLTEYSGIRYMAESERKVEFGPIGFEAVTNDRLSYAFMPAQPSNLPAWDYGDIGYGSAVYSKTALGLWTLEKVVGSERFRQAMAAYLSEWRFRHPTAADFRVSLERSLSDFDLCWFFDEFIATSGVIDYAVGGIEHIPEGIIVTVQRQGAVQVPVEVQVTLASGAQQIQQWDGKSDSVRLAFAASDPVVLVEIDPEEKLVAELDRTDNGADTRVQVGPVLTLGGRLVFWTQTMMQLLGLFG